MTGQSSVLRRLCASHLSLGDCVLIKRLKQTDHLTIMTITPDKFYKSGDRFTCRRLEESTEVMVERLPIPPAVIPWTLNLGLLE